MAVPKKKKVVKRTDPPKKKASKGNLKTASNTDNELTPFNFKVPKWFKEEFKDLAYENRMNMTEFLKHLVKEHKERS